jgi:pyridoxal phosphate enzyme (YggS family)
MEIKERIEAVQAEIARVCQRSGRPLDSVTLVAVSKTHPVEEILAAVDAGLRQFGENRVEDALPKIAAAGNASIQWHMIGHLQSRKVRYVTADFALLHSLDNLKLADKLSRMCVEQGRVLPVLLEMNVSGEETKEGWSAYHWKEDHHALWDEIRQVIALPGLSVRGLMTMAPIVDDPEEARPVFAVLRDLREALAADFPQTPWTELSMGMTDDYPIAIEEGATLVRIGRAIFGPRLM